MCIANNICIDKKSYPDSNQFSRMEEVERIISLMHRREEIRHARQQYGEDCTGDIVRVVEDLETRCDSLIKDHDPCLIDIAKVLFE